MWQEAGGVSAREGSPTVAQSEWKNRNYKGGQEYLGDSDGHLSKSYYVYIFSPL